MVRKILTTDYGPIAYWISDAVDPARDTLFFMHGMTADHTMFDQQVIHFEKNCNVIAWDAPAHGQSRPYRGFSFDGAAEFIMSILNEHHISDVVLIGQSLGGYFAQSFIRRFPGSVKGFVCIGGTPYGESYYSKLDRWILKQVEWMAHLYPLGVMKKAMAKQVSVTAKGRDNMKQMLEPYDKRELCRLMGLSYSTFLKENGDMEIPCPVILLIGEFDKTGKVKAYNEAWTKKTGYPLIRISGAAHNANVDKPDEVNSIIEGFLKKL